MPLDLIITPIYRINGQEAPALPGLLALMPPPNAARGRERDHLIVYLLLAGNAIVTTGEYAQLAQDAAEMFYQTAGATTTALRAAIEITNAALLQRNMNSSAQGQYAAGWLTLAALRDSQCLLALSGPMQAAHFGQRETRRIYEPGISGKGLGVSQTAGAHYAQISLAANDLLLFFGRAPAEWTPALQDSTPVSLGALRRKLTASAPADLNAVLMQAAEGKGRLRLLSGTEEIKDRQPAAAPPPSQSPAAPAHVIQAASYSAPPADSAAPPNPPRDFPPSIPRLRKAAEEGPRQPESVPESAPAAPPETKKPLTRRERLPRRREPSERVRRTARRAAAFIQWSRGVGDAFSAWFAAVLPRLLPTHEVEKPYAASNFVMLAIAVIVPLTIAVAGFAVFDKYGRGQQYQIYLSKARDLRAQALAVTDPVAQRKSWEAALLNAELAETNAPGGKPTAETSALRREANQKLDELLGVQRLSFSPAFSVNLGFDVSRMAANDFDLYMLNADSGAAMRAQSFSGGRGFQLDTAFVCGPGKYGEYQVEPLVDILALPGLNVYNAALLGIDGKGNLLYCAPGQVPRAIPLPAPDTGWKRVTAFTMDGDNLYVLDAAARAVWVYIGKDGTFLDRPYFFFGNQTPEKEDAIDLIVSGDELFLLHADGRLSNCSYSRIESKPTRCQEPTYPLNRIPAYQDIDLFSAANFTQLLFAVPPDSALLLLDASRRALLRVSPRSFELQNQFMPQTEGGYVVPRGKVSAAALSPNHALYLAIDGQIYFATNVP